MDWTRGFALALLPTLIGCGADDAGTAGLRIAEWTVAPEPSVVIGGHDERAGYLIERLAGATRLSDGRIVLVDAGASEARVYDAAGVHLVTHGREGRGPGELQRVFTVQRGRADTVLVGSMEPGLSWIHPDGGIVRQERFSVWSFSVECRFAEGGLGWRVLPTARLFYVFEESGSCPPERQGPHRNTALLALLDRESGGIDSVAVLPSTGRNGRNYRVFGHSLEIAIDADRIFAADSGADSIVVFSFDGNRLPALGSPFAAEPVPVEARAQDVRRWTDQNGNERVGEPYAYPDLLPRVAGLEAARDGRLWVMKYPTRLDRPVVSYELNFGLYHPPGGTEWAVLSPVGEVVARASLPERFLLLEAGADYVLGVARDELDVESLVLYELLQ